MIYRIMENLEDLNVPSCHTCLLIDSYSVFLRIADVRC